MKKSFLASLLAVALVIGVAFPLSAGLKAKAVTNDEAIAQIKAAFDEVYTTETVLTPLRQKFSSAGASAIPEGETADKSYYVKTSNGLPSVGGEASKLGDAWALFRQFGDGSKTTTESTNRILYQYQTASGAYPAASAAKIKDYEVSLYVESAPENKDVSVKLNSVIKGGTSNFSGLYTISPDNFGKWVTVKSSELSGKNWQEVLKTFDFSDSANNFYIQMLVYDSVEGVENGPVIYTGSVLGHFGLEAPAAFSDENASLFDIIFAARNIVNFYKNDANVYNIDKLQSAINDVISNASEEQAKELLVSAYNNIVEVKTLKVTNSNLGTYSYVPTVEKVRDESVESKNTNYYAKSTNKDFYFENTDENYAKLPSGIDKAYLGDAYLNFKRSYEINSGDGMNRLVFGDYNDFGASGQNTQTILDATSGYNDIKIALYIEDVKQSGTIQFTFVNTNYSTAYLKSYSIDGNSAGKWHLISLSDFFDGDISALNDKINGNLGFIQLIANNAVYKGYVGSFVMTKPIDKISATEFDKFDLVDTIINFNDRLANINGGNIGALNDILSVLNSKYSVEIDRRQYIKSTADEIKSAYSDIKTDLVSVLLPNKAKIANAAAGWVDKSDYFATNENSFIANCDSAISEKALGTNFAHFDLTTNYDKLDTNSYDRVLFNQKDGNWAKFETAGYDGFYINVYINKVMQEGALKPLFVMIDKEDVSKNTTKTGKDISVTSDMAGKWITLSDKDLFNGGLESLQSFGNYYFSSLQMNLCKNLGIDAYFGSIVFYKNAQTPDMSNMTADEVYEKAKSDLDNFDKTGASIESASFRNSIMKLGNLLNKTSVKGCVSGHYASGVTVRDAVKLQHYLSDSSISIDRYAADINNDGIINEDDLSALFDMILK